MKHKVILTELDGLELEVDKSMWTGRTKVFINGSELSRQEQGKYYEIMSNDGTVRKLKIKGASFDGVPKVYIDDREIQMARKLSTLEYIVSAIPMILLIVGGALGGVFGAIALMANFRAMRSNMSKLSKALVVIASTIAAGVLYVVCAIVITMLFNA